MSNEQKIIVIVGPTASGKSDYAVRLAKYIERNKKKFDTCGAEIISADSRQVYRGMDIGTGKITKKEMRGVPHHLLDVVSPKKTYTVADYQKDARRVLEKIFKKNKIAIVCGGTGFYIDALIRGLVIPEVPPNNALRKKLSKKNADSLFAILEKKDPVRAKTIDRKNPVRLVRAIEITTALGAVPIPQNSPLTAKTLFIGVSPKKEILHKKISMRLKKRIRAGMIYEVIKLKKSGISWKKLDMFGLEYRYLSRYLAGKMKKREALEALEKEINAYAKRQMTWFKRNNDIHWIKNRTEIRMLLEKFLFGK